MLQRYQAKVLYDSGHLQELSNHWINDENHNSYGEWEYYYIARSFYEMKQFDSCIEVYDEFHERFPNSHKLDFYTGWSLYHSFIKTFDCETQDPNNLIEKLDQILNLEKSKISAHNRSIIKTCSLLYNSRSAVPGKWDNSEIVWKYLNLISPDELNDNPFEINNGQRDITLPTEKESWYISKSKTLWKFKNYDQCIECIDEAFSKAKEMNRNISNILINRKAECLIKLNRLAEARELLNSMKSKNKWHTDRTLFNLEDKLGNYEEARKYAANCSLFDQDHYSRVNFYSDYARFLEKIGLAEEAQWHWKLVRNIRIEHDMQLSADEEKRYIAPEVKALDKRTLMTRLKEFWLHEITSEERLKGTMQRAINARSGTVIPDGRPNESYYFFFGDIIGTKQTPIPGQRLSFVLEERENLKTGQKKVNAVKLLFEKD